jgi:serine phosphatase RsbU (regulator of sigma subunit)
VYVFSDGAFEIQKSDGGTWTQEEFLQFLSERQSDVTPIDAVLEQCTYLHGPGTLDDDCSIVQCDL